MTIFDPDYELKPVEDYYTDLEIVELTGLTPDEIMEKVRERRFPVPLLVHKYIFPKDLVDIYLKHYGRVSYDA